MTFSLDTYLYQIITKSISMTEKQILKRMLETYKQYRDDCVPSQEAWIKALELITTGD